MGRIAAQFKVPYVIIAFGSITTSFSTAESAADASGAVKAIFSNNTDRDIAVRIGSVSALVVPAGLGIIIDLDSGQQPLELPATAVEIAALSSNPTSGSLYISLIHAVY